MVGNENNFLVHSYPRSRFNGLFMAVFDGKKQKINEKVIFLVLFSPEIISDEYTTITPHLSSDATVFSIKDVAMYTRD